VFVCEAPRDSSDLGVYVLSSVSHVEMPDGIKMATVAYLGSSLHIYCTSNLKRQYRLKMGRTSGALYILHIKVKETVQNKDGEYLGSSLYIAHQS
jgi:hypothetical protein